MIDEAQQLQRKAAYIDAIRALHRTERNAGFVACLAGVLLLVWARFGSGAPAFALWAALAAIGLGWALFAYSIFRRTAWVRAHPFDPGD